MNYFWATSAIAGLAWLVGSDATAQIKTSQFAQPRVEKNASQEPRQEKARAPSQPWLENDLAKIRRQLQASLVAEPALMAELTKIDWDDPVDLHQRVIGCLQKVPTNLKWLDRARDPTHVLPKDGSWMRLDSHLQLEIAMILVKTDRPDQALELLDAIDTSRLVEPGLALLYKTVCLHQQVRVEPATKLAAILMAHRDKLPERYATMTESLYNDLRKHEDQPLHTVARLMADAGRRQQRQEHSAEALRQEAEIVDRLDKIIRDLEKQQQQQQQASSGGPSSRRPSPSSPDSGGSGSLPKTTGPKATGDVQSKNQDAAGNWGSISPQERTIAVKSMVRELPPHFRALLKAYFQKLAEENK